MDKKYGVVVTMFVHDDKLKDQSIGTAFDMTENQIKKVNQLLCEIYEENYPDVDN